MYDKDVYDLLTTVVLVATTDKDNLKVNRHLNKQSSTQRYMCVSMCVDACVRYVCLHVIFDDRRRSVVEI